MPDLNKLTEVQSSIEFIETHLTYEISVADVCKNFERSSWEFQRLFRAYTGTSIGDYIRSRRLSEAAREMIENPKTRILDTAIKYQFGSQEAFTRAFSKQFKMTPGEAKTAQAHVRLFYKIKIDNERLLHNLKGINRTPQLVLLPERSYIGMQIEIASPFTEDKSYMKDVSDLWEDFNPRRKEIANRIKGVGYGLVLSPTASMTEDRLPYVASVEVDDSVKNPPQGMVRIDLKAQLYAQFEKQGLANKTKMSMDYIYGFWLPQSGYKRAKGYDIEIFDHRLHFNNPDSISVYSIPIETANSRP